MGLFSWLRAEKTNVEVLPDTIWLTKFAKFSGMANVVQGKLAAAHPPLAVILVAHFPDCLTELETLVESEFAGNPVMAAESGGLSAATSTRAGLDESQTIDLVIAERHPLLSHDEAIEEFARSLPCKVQIARHVSLEDPTMKLFAGDWVRDMLKRLGMKDDEAIESKMVARRIMDAHRKIQDRAWSDEPADSAEQWIERNSPELR